jgi:hypothetical protein
MNKNEQEYRAALQRIERFQRQVEQLRKTESHPHSYCFSASGCLAELDRMQLEVREYFWAHPPSGTGWPWAAFVTEQSMNPAKRWVAVDGTSASFCHEAAGTGAA